MESKRDFAMEIAAATADGDVKALAALAIHLSNEVTGLQRDAATTQRRRKADADRKRGRQEPEVCEIPQKSAEIVGTPPMEAEPSGTGVTPPSPPSPSLLPPTPPNNSSPSPTPPQQQPLPRAREGADGQREDWRTALGVTGQPLLDAMAELTGKLGDGESSGRTVEDFIGQAPSASRFAWTRSLISALDPLGGQRVAPDVLLLAMEDFLIADRGDWPWVARVFRAFVADVAAPKAEKRRRAEPEPAPADALARWAKETEEKETQAKVAV